MNVSDSGELIVFADVSKGTSHVVLRRGNSVVFKRNLYAIVLRNNITRFIDFVPYVFYRLLLNSFKT